MEQPHLSSQLDYLEQKLQEANATIAGLQQRVESQEYTIQEQNLRIQHLENDLTEAKQTLQSTTQIEGRLSKLKDEMLEYIERRTSRSQAAVSESSNSLILTQLETHTTAISEVRRDLEKTERLQDQISLARSESDRLNKEVQKFQAQLDQLTRALDERTSPLKIIEEQRHTDVRKLAELQAELPALEKKITDTTTKVQLVSQQIPQYAKYEAALESIREEIRGYREHMDFQLAQRERQIKDWTGIATATEERIREIERSMEKYTEFYQLNKRSLSSLQDFQERIQREQHRVSELQRLTEERQRTEAEKFRADFEKRWQKQSLELQPQFEDFHRRLETLQRRIDDLLQLHTTIDRQLNVALQIIEEDVQARAQAASDWQRRFEEIVEG
jgi:chromosome segregation ATPase